MSAIRTKTNRKTVMIILKNFKPEILLKDNLNE